jgi:WD40 repeat protein
MGFDGNLNRLKRKLEKKSLDRDYKEFWRDVDRWDHCEKVTFGVPGDRPRVLVFSPCKVVICATFQSLMFFSLENFEKSQEFIERRIDSDHSINFIKVCTRSFVLFLGRGNCLIFYELGYDTTLKKPIVKDLGRKDFDLYINSFIIFQEMLVFCFKDKENPCLNFYQDTKSLQKPLICLKLKGNKGEIQSILSWHDKIVATTNEGDLFLISFKGFQLKQRCKADDFQIQKISKFLNKIILTEVSEKTKIMIASDSNVIHAWDMNSGRLHGFLIGHHGSVKVFSHCKEGKKVVSADGLFVVRVLGC